MLTPQIVVKLGGSALAYPAHFHPALEAIRAAAHQCRLLVVPGGGPFADAVRDVDRRLRLADDTAHWMAVLAMDQYAHLIAARLTDAVLVTSTYEIGTAFERNQIPVLAPYRWLREADPLPHTWEVTSDSIAAWIAGEVGASRLVLIKPPGVRVHTGALQRTTTQTTSSRDTMSTALDGYFAQALPASVTPIVVPIDRTDELAAELESGTKNAE